ncbi:Olfactory receptor 4C15 [Lemmus lemmus]
MTQIFAVHFFAAVEVIVLIVMAYDRYVAICKPLYYSSIMNWRHCGILVGVAWAGGFLHSIIQHFMCDLFPLLELSCTDTYIYALLVFANSGSICIIIFSMMLISYGVILFSLRNHSADGRWKALSTCGCHIAVVISFFVPCIFVYARCTSASSFEKKVAVFDAIMTPLLNPMIYTFRNKEMKNVIKKMWKI